MLALNTGLSVLVNDQVRGRTGIFYKISGCLFIRMGWTIKESLSPWKWAKGANLPHTSREGPEQRQRGWRWRRQERFEKYFQGIISWTITNCMWKIGKRKELKLPWKFLAQALGWIVVIEETKWERIGGISGKDDQIYFWLEVRCSGSS